MYKSKIGSSTGQNSNPIEMSAICTNCGSGCAYGCLTSCLFDCSSDCTVICGDECSLSCKGGLTRISPNMEQNIFN